VKQNRDENEEAECRANLEAAGDCNAIDERVKQKSSKRRDAHSLGHFVHFLTKMEMRDESVLCEMNQQKSDENQRRRGGAVLLDRLGREVENGNRYHESRGESDQLLERGHAPLRSPCDCGRACKGVLAANLPPWIANRPKTGFFVPMRDWANLAPDGTSTRMRSWARVVFDAFAGANAD